MKVKLISTTQPALPLKRKGIKTAEDLIVYCARVSNPSNQMNSETAPKLLKYLIKHKHWSPFEMANMCVEIKTSRAIAAQIYDIEVLVFRNLAKDILQQHSWSP